MPQGGAASSDLVAPCLAVTSAALSNGIDRQMTSLQIAYLMIALSYLAAVVALGSMHWGGYENNYVPVCGIGVSD